MGLLGLFKGEGLSKPIEAVGNVLDKVFTSKEEKLGHQELMARIAQQPALVNLELNKIEASHRSVFVAGWRPSIGWVCSLALLYNYVIKDIANYFIAVIYPEVDLMPPLQMEHLMTVLGALLGLGGLRTFEKLKGKTK